MFKKILVPLDGSKISEMAIPYAEELAGKLGSEVVLYHVRPHDHAELEHMHQTYLDSVAESFRYAIKNKLPKANDVTITTEIEPGEAAENICRLVDKNQVDLIVMTAVSNSGLKIGKTIGSIADHVCRTVPIPVLLVRSQSTPPIKSKPLIKRILIPLDGSELSKLALPVGEELAAGLEGTVTLFRMSNNLRLVDDGSGATLTIDYAGFNEAEKTRVTTEMTALEKDLKNRGFDVTSVVTAGFDPAYEIIEISAKTNVDLLVMSTHGRSGPGRWVYGNTAEKVLRHGTTPLLLVHARAG